MTKLRMTKLQRDHAAHERVCAWARDWDNIGPEPSAKDLMRAAAAIGYYGRNSRNYSERSLRYAQVPSKPREYAVYEQGKCGTGTRYPANLDKGLALEERYARFAHHMQEARHNWQFVRNEYFADNSTECIERSLLAGATRRRMVTPPSGDICY